MKTPFGALAVFTALLLLLTASPEAKDPPVTRGGLETALISAASRGDVPGVRRLLREGAGVDAADDRGATALIAAAYGNHVEAARLLIEAGADVNRPDRTLQSAYLISTSEGYLELLKTDIRIDHVNHLGWTALLEAILLGDGSPRYAEVVRLLLEAGADPNRADASGISPLAHARNRGFAEIAAILERHGARRAPP